MIIKNDLHKNFIINFLLRLQNRAKLINLLFFANNFCLHKKQKECKCKKNSIDNSHVSTTFVIRFQYG